MKTPLITFLLLFVFILEAESKTNLALPRADAGPDQTVYLTHGSVVTLNGSSSSGGSFQWTKIYDVYPDGAIPPVDPAKIVTPGSSITSVTGLIQGVWYYQLAVTGNGVTALDTVVIRVDYDMPPANSTLALEVPITNKNFAKVINNRDDTTQIPTYSQFPNRYYDPAVGGNLNIERSRANGAMIDSSKGKLYSTLEDGYGWTNNNYARSQLTYGTNYLLDSNKTYVIELKCYFPQSVHDNMTSVGSPDWATFAIFGIHENDAFTGTGEIGGKRDSITWTDGQSKTVIKLISTDPSVAGQAHTYRITLRQGKGYPGQDAFVKVEVDGVQKFYRDTGDVGRTWQEAYLKLTGLYDYGRRLVDPANKTRNKKFSLVTEACRIYILAENKPPKADAGTNQVVTLPQNSVALSGSGSDMDGTITSYQWTKISGPAAYKIVNPNLAKTEVSGLVQGTYQFKLTVTDNSGSSAYALVSVTVNAANISPVANAGSGKIITLPTDLITLSGTGNDADGTIKSYLWSKVAGPAVYNIVNPGLATTDVSGLVEGVYQFKLTVTDNDGAFGSATIQITVNAPVNKPPTATVGSDKSITLPTNTTSLSGSGSDADGTIASYKWTKISGPSSYNIVNATSPVTDVAGLVQGVYQFQLTVKDNKEGTGTAVMQVNVNAAANIPPTASAGANQSITLPANSVNLTGSGKDPDGAISSYQWTKILGPASFKISNPNSASTDVSNLIAGSYQFKLTVKDDKGDVGESTVQVTVNEGPTNNAATSNKVPVAYAGSDTTLVLPGNSVTLTGNGIDTDGTIKSWKWVQVAGPAASNISTEHTAKTEVSNLIEGTYEFELTVKDDKGLVGKDTLSVTVALGRLARESNSVKVYPNPVSEEATIEINSSKSTGNLKILITDMLGKTVYIKEFISPGTNVKEKINLEGLIKGAYIISVFIDGSRTQSVKVVKL